MKIELLDSQKQLNLSSFQFREIPDNPVRYNAQKDAFIYNGIEFPTEQEANDYKNDLEMDDQEMEL